MTVIEVPSEPSEADAEQIRQRVHQRVNELQEELPEPPWFQVIQNGGGHIDPMHRFPTEEEAEEYHRIRFGGSSGKQGYLAYHRQNWGGLITRSLRKIQEPKMFCIVEERTGRVVYTGLLPTEDHRSDGASAYDNPTVWEKFEYHLPPFPEYIRDGREQDARFCPEDYDGNQLDWHREQVETFTIHIASPDLFEQQYGDR